MLVSSYPFPNLIIPGVQKAGTTALASFLSQHPDICIVEGKEAHVFDDPDYYNANDKASFARKKFEGKLKHYNGEKYILDATPITLLHPAFIEASSRHCLNAKYLVMVRDPIERALSHYAMTKSRNLEPLSPLRAFLSEPWRMRGLYRNLPSAPFESPYRDQSYLTRGKYRKQIDNLVSFVGSENIMQIQQQDLNEQHNRTLDSIFQFLDLPTISVEHKRVFASLKSYQLSTWEKLLTRFIQIIV